MWKLSQYAIFEAVEPFKLHPISISYIYYVFEHLTQLWMGIWQHIHTVTTTDVSPDLEEFAEIIDDVNVKTIPICYRWVCRTFQTASHIHVIHLLGVWTPYTVVDGNMAAHSYSYHHRRIPRFGELAEIIDYVNMKTIPIRYQWGCRTFQTASHIHVIHTLCVWTPYTVVDGHMAAHSYSYHHRCIPRFGEFAEIIDDVNVKTIPIRYRWGCRTFQTASHIHVINILCVWTL